MIEGARWRKWVFFYVPMALFLLFCVYWTTSALWERMAPRPSPVKNASASRNDRR